MCKIFLLNLFQRIKCCFGYSVLKRLVLAAICAGNPIFVPIVIGFFKIPVIPFLAPLAIVWFIFTILLASQYLMEAGVMLCRAIENADTFVITEKNGDVWTATVGRSSPARSSLLKAIAIAKSKSVTIIIEGMRRVPITKNDSIDVLEKQYEEEMDRLWKLVPCG